MGYHAHGDAVIVYQTADEAVFDKAKDLFDEYLASYDFDCEVGDYEITVYAWGFGKYSKYFTAKLLDKLKSIAPIVDGSEYDFRGDDDELWRFVFENGDWKYQIGDIVYHD